MSTTDTATGTRIGLIDLAATRLGGMVLASNDEYFGAKENLLTPGPPRYDPNAYADRGKVMDGWETRRGRDGGDDWCTIRLGVTGIVRAIVVDTTHFKGNYPEACSIEGTLCDDDEAVDGASWWPLLDRTRLSGDAEQRIDVDRTVRVSHVRLTIHPDGGVARLRLLGHPLVDLAARADRSGRTDLAATISGGRVVACSDEFFGAPSNLIAIGDARDMSDGWETRRRRGPGEDWVILQLATLGEVERIELDTTHFKGNFPDRCRIEASDTSDPAAAHWEVLVADTPLRPHARHQFEVRHPSPISHLRVVAIPDGGIARVRVHGRITDRGWALAAVALLDAMADECAADLLRGCCAASAWVEQMVAARPFRDPDLLHRAADKIWQTMTSDDLLQAFDAHPRIGDRTGSARSRGEQAGTADADAATLEDLHDGNVAYEDRFGFVFLIRAAGRTAAEMLAALNERLTHDKDTELQIASQEQAQITRLRLDALLTRGGLS